MHTRGWGDGGCEVREAQVSGLIAPILGEAPNKKEQVKYSRLRFSWSVERVGGVLYLKVQNKLEAISSSSMKQGQEFPPSSRHGASCSGTPLAFLIFGGVGGKPHFTEESE